MSNYRKYSRSTLWDSAVLIAECRSRIDEFEYVLERDRNADSDDKEND